MISIQIERWDDFFSDGSALFPVHWKELARNQKEIPLDIDRQQYARLDEIGVLLIITAREDEKLVGYYLWYLMPHPHYANSGPMALTDMYFVLPESRQGVGLKLFSFSERELRKRGIVKAMTSCKVHENHSELLQALGWELSDLTFSKLLGAS